MLLAIMAVAVLFLAYKLAKRDAVILFILLCGFVMQFMLLLAYRYELVTVWHRQVYWSDIEIYWRAIQQMLRTGQIPEVHNVGFVVFSYWVLKTLGIYDPFVLNISNLLLLDISIFLLAIWTKNYTSYKSNIRLLLIVIFLNPFVTYALLRIVKDALFLMLSISTLLFVDLWAKTTRRRFILSLPILVGLSIILQSIRPWGFMVPWIFVFSVFVISDIPFGRKILITTLCLLAFAGVFWFQFRGVSTWFDIVFARAKDQSTVSLIKGPLRSLIGPGPIRPFNPERHFIYWTNIGNVATFVGASLWWLMLPVFMLILTRVKRDTLVDFFPLIALTGTFLIIYTLNRGGGLEFRHRGVLYTFVAGIACGFWRPSRQDPRLTGLVYWVIESLVIVGGIFFG
jgi:hypothetical protein